MHEVPTEGSGPKRGEQAPADPGASGAKSAPEHLSPAARLRLIDEALKRIRECFFDPAWGSPHGLKVAARTPESLASSHPEKLETLFQHLSDTLSVLTIAARTPGLSAAIYVNLLRRTVFSDSFLLSLYVTTHPATSHGTSRRTLVDGFERAAKELVRGCENRVTAILQSRDEEDLLKQFKMMAIELKDIDEPPTPFENFRFGSAIENYPDIFSVLLNPRHPAAASVKEGLEARSEGKRALEAIERLLIDKK